MREYGAIALILVNIVPCLDNKGRELASDH